MLVLYPRGAVRSLCADYWDGEVRISLGMMMSDEKTKRWGFKP